MMKIMTVREVLKLKGLDEWQRLCLKVSSPETRVEVEIVNGRVELGNEVK